MTVIDIIMKAGGQATINTKDNKEIGGNSPMHFAAEQNLVKIVEIFAGFGAELNEKNIRGHTPLHLAAMNGHAVMVSVLLAKGNDIFFNS
jgi:ankyrin repeat protein